MGRNLNGLFLSFQAMTSMGGLGDLGMGYYVNIQTSRHLGQGKKDELLTFLAAARGFFVLATVVIAAGFAVVSPWLLKWLHFDSDPFVGPLPFLAAVGTTAIALLILSSYIFNLSYGCGNIMWPIVPTFLGVQAAILCHWLLARAGYPLWIQYLPYVVAQSVAHALAWLYVRISHPWLAKVLPLEFRPKEVLPVAGNSIWVYMLSFPGLVQLTVSRLLIAGVFDPGLVTNYAYNNRLAELAMFVVTAASLASMPKLTQWMSSPETNTRQRAITELIRVNKFQTLLGCCAALVYLNVNDWFIGFWLGHDIQAPVSWQAAFAGYLAITAGCLMGYDLAARCCDHGIRVGGATTLITALLNIGLCWIAVRHHSIFGIALASFITQSGSVLFLGWFSSRQLKISWWRLSLKNWLLGVSMVGIGMLSRHLFAGKTGLSILLGGVVIVLAVWFVLLVTGITWQDLRHEKNVFLAMLGRRSGAASKGTGTQA